MSAPPISSALPGYADRTQGYDEAVATSGETRPVWRPLSRAIAAMSPAELESRQRQADRLVESEGASHLFHDFGDDASRPWRLDPLPLIIGGTEWSALERGIAQRARVLERLIADSYGERRFVRAGAVPARALFAAPGFLLAAQGMTPQSRWLTVYAADLVRLATGEWRVLRDLTDAPSGAGYALVNRKVSAQLLAEVVREMAPISPAGFFENMRSALDSIAPQDRPSPRSVVLSPGPGHPSYFEHSYLAAHLGYHLGEPGDLVVRKGKVWLRALSGLEPVDVLLRRIEGRIADPLESGRGATGVPGLARVARDRGVGLANALGSGVAASLTLLPYVAIAAQALGEALTLGEVETLWCGSPAARDEVLAAPDRFVLHDTAGAGPPHAKLDTAFGSKLDPAAWQRWCRLIESEPQRVIAQRKQALATAPVLSAGGVGPATFVLRVLAVVGRDATTVMPGGLARVVDPTTPIANQTSGLTKDVWVLDDRAERPLPITVPVTRSMPQVDLRESLPTRAAEAMYWVGRNAERSESMARATAAALAVVQADPALLGASDGGWRRPVVAALRSLTGERVGALRTDGTGTTDPDDELRDAVARTLVGADGLPGTLRGLSRAASSARQFLSTTTWRVLGELDDERTHLADDVAGLDDAGVRRRLDTVIVHLSSLSGLFNESTVRGPAWRFLEIGRRLDRSFALLTLFDTVISPATPELRRSLFDYVLAASESLVAYRRRYRSDVVLDALFDLLVLDDQNPRALAFQLDRLRSQVVLLPARDASAALATRIDEAATALMDVSWLSSGADQLGAHGRRDSVDRFVAAARAPLRRFADQLTHVYFNDPTRMRQRIGGT